MTLNLPIGTAIYGVLHDLNVELDSATMADLVRWLESWEQSVRRRAHAPLPPQACVNCDGRGVLNLGLGLDDQAVWVPPYPCPVCDRSGLAAYDGDGQICIGRR